MRLKTFDQFVCLILIHFVNVNPKKNLSFVFSVSSNSLSPGILSDIYDLGIVCFLYLAHRFFYKTQGGYKGIYEKERNKQSERE